MKTISIVFVVLIVAVVLFVAFMIAEGLNIIGVIK
jgi:hypothetical protein